jgi:hypothetical protein
VKANQTNGCPGVSQGRMNLFVIKENPICLTESSHSTVNNSILTYLETGEGEEMMHRNSNASKFERESQDQKLERQIVFSNLGNVYAPSELP